MELRKECFGCSACVHACPNQCIEMGQNAAGFFVPVWAEKNKCTDCGVCRQVCPMTETSLKPDGEMKKAYLVVNRDSYDRNLSSSGGFFKALADLVFQQGGVVCGAAFADEFLIRHQWVEDKNAVYPLLGSKYVQSNLNNTFSQIKTFLEQGKYVLFAGTSCQAAGLKNFLREGTGCGRLITADLICHGVPSQKVWKKYLEECHKGKEIRYVQFRCKAKGWWESNLRLQYAHADYMRENRLEDPYMRMFLNGISLNPCCYDCRFRSKKKYSDFYMGDAWNINRIRTNMDDGRGVTAVFVNSEKGQNLIEKMENIHCFEVELEEALFCREDLLKNKEMPAGRKVFFENLEKGFITAVKECEKI